MAEVAKTCDASSVAKAAGARRRKRNASALAAGSSRVKGSAAVNVSLGGPVIRESIRWLPLPPFGAVMDAGRLPTMEDAVDIKTNLCSPYINRGRPIHYFGVFDGHGGSHFAIMCKEKLHAILEEELMRLIKVQIGDENVLQEIWKTVISRVFSRTELVALNTCVCRSVRFQCNCSPDATSYTGTTAVVVVVTEEHIVAGNCGDSRAVLYRGGSAFPLTFDHKPDREDEKARIIASGGQVTIMDAARVEGLLAMSRAIGDKYLKPYVISEPDVTFTRRDEEDEFLIMASDGIWDVISGNMAGRVVRQCFKDSVTGDDVNVGPNAEKLPSASTVAAGLLCRLALARGSADNVSVVVVDLKTIGGTANI